MARRYWLTVHWPPYRGSDDPNPYVWLQQGKEHVATGMRRGDYVAVYEYQGGPDELIEDGRILRGSHDGAQAIIWHGRVTRLLEPVGDERTYWRYGGSYPMTWICYAELRIIARGGVGREELNRILGHGRDSVLRGFGPDHSGLLEVSREQFDQMTSP